MNEVNEEMENNQILWNILSLFKSNFRKNIILNGNITRMVNARKVYKVLEEKPGGGGKGTVCLILA
jgi:hypothetical protein